MHTLILGLFLGCGEKADSSSSAPGSLPSTGEVIATVNDQNIHQGTVDDILSQFSEDKIKEFKASGGLEQIKEQLILTEVLYQEAIKAKMHEKPEVKTALSMAARGVLAEAMVQSKAEESATDEAIQKWYDEHLVQFRKNAVDLSMIMSATEAEAQGVKAELDGGGDFAALAKAKSTDPRTKDNGGSMGSVDMRQLPPDIKTPVEAGKDGDLIGPMNLFGQWAVLKINKKINDVTPLEEVKDQVKESVMREQSQTYVEELRAAATVVMPGGDASKEEAKTPAPLDKEALQKDLNPPEK